jgi:hypothetical protein
VQLSLAQHKLASQSELSQPHTLRMGARLCLNERCERTFQPTHHLDRYCGPECLADARRWQVRFANQLYRRSADGRERRREQSRRYRLKLKVRMALDNEPEQENFPLSDQPEASREGYTKDTSHEKSCCHRPGCYRRFTAPPQSPLKKFCSPRCRNALRRVILRERLWIARLKSTLKHKRDGPQSQAS